MLLSHGAKPSGGESQPHSYTAAEPALTPRCCDFGDSEVAGPGPSIFLWSQLVLQWFNSVLEKGLAPSTTVVVMTVAVSTAAGFLPVMFMLLFYESIKQSTHRQFTTATWGRKTRKQHCSDLFSDVTQLLVVGNRGRDNVPNHGKATEQAQKLYARQVVWREHTFKWQVYFSLPKKTNSGKASD